MLEEDKQGATRDEDTLKKDGSSPEEVEEGMMEEPADEGQDVSTASDQEEPEVAPCEQEVTEEELSDEPVGDSEVEISSDEDQWGQILESITELHKKFDQKIAQDKYKNQLFDNMHSELTDFRNGAVDKPLEAIALDIIRMEDDLKDSIDCYEDAELTEANFNKLLKILKNTCLDIDDLLYRQGIEPFSVEGDEVDVRRQKIIGNIETIDETLHNTIALRSVCGYEKDSKVIRPERVKIYKYTDTDSEQGNDKDTE